MMGRSDCECLPNIQYTLWNDNNIFIRYNFHLILMNNTNAIAKIYFHWAKNLKLLFDNNNNFIGCNRHRLFVILSGYYQTFIKIFIIRWRSCIVFIVCILLYNIFIFFSSSIHNLFSLVDLSRPFLIKYSNICVHDNTNEKDEEFQRNRITLSWFAFFFSPAYFRFMFGSNSHSHLSCSHHLLENVRNERQKW